MLYWEMRRAEEVNANVRQKEVFALIYYSASEISPEDENAMRQATMGRFGPAFVTRISESVFETHRAFDLFPLYAAHKSLVGNATEFTFSCNHVPQDAPFRLKDPVQKRLL